MSSLLPPLGGCRPPGRAVSAAEWRLLCAYLTYLVGVFVSQGR